MKITTDRAMFLTRSTTVALIICGAASSLLAGSLPSFLRGDAASKSAPRTLTFAQRVAYQRAIEGVYWRHRIWPKERPDPKPSIDPVMPEAHPENAAEGYRRNGEGFIGTVKTPVGVAGPLLVNGTSASGMYHVPLATTEAALVASYSRGAQLIPAAGGCAAGLANDGARPAPARPASGLRFKHSRHSPRRRRARFPANRLRLGAQQYEDRLPRHFGGNAHLRIGLANWNKIPRRGHGPRRDRPARPARPRRVQGHDEGA